LDAEPHHHRESKSRRKKEKRGKRGEGRGKRGGDWREVFNSFTEVRSVLKNEKNVI
jgi:hypothetical protein